MAGASAASAGVAGSGDAASSHVGWQAKVRHKFTCIVAVGVLADLVLALVAFQRQRSFHDFIVTEPGVAPGHTKKNNTNNTATVDIRAIPRIVHQEWKDRELPPNFKIWRDECIRLNPEWEFKLWTDDENLKLVQEHYPSLLNVYNGYKENIKRIDMIRFLYLHNFGGVYMDLDLACMKPFDSFFDEYPNKFLVVNQYKKDREYANAFMASPPDHDIFESIFNELPLQMRQNVIEATGGLFLQYHVLPKSINKGKWVEMPFDLFYAQDWIQAKTSRCNSFDDCQTKYPNAITASMWTSTWAGNATSRASTEWQNSSNISVVKYNITKDIANQIFVSGVFDKDFCLECIWNGRIPCHRRLDYMINVYGSPREEVIHSLVHTHGVCRATATMSNNLTQNENATVQ